MSSVIHAPGTARWRVLNEERAELSEKESSMNAQNHFTSSLALVHWPTRRCTKVVAALLVALIGIGVGATVAEGAHHRFSHVHWSAGTGPNDIDFVVQSAWRYGFANCHNPNNPAQQIACTGPGGNPGFGDIVTVTGGPPPRFQFGDGTEFFAPVGYNSLLYLVTATDPVNQWFFGTAIDHTQLPSIVTTISKTYAAPGDYVAFMQACCRLSATAAPNRHVNNPGGSYRIETIVNVGTGNSSPVSLVPPTVNCPIDAVCTFQVAASDPDGDTLRFRLSTPQEATGSASFNQPGPPQAPNALSIDPDTGIVTWDTTGADLGGVDPTTWNVLYSTHITIEDLDANGNVKSAVAVDFFIQLVPETGDPPMFAVGPCGDTLTVNVGQTLQFTVEAVDPDGDDVTLNAIGVPAGATFNPPLPVTGPGSVSSEFNWTPTAGQVGTHIVVLTAIDQFGQFVQCPVTLIVQEVGDQGCSLGFWKQPHHFGHWQGHDPDDLFCDVFDCSTPASVTAYGGKSLHQVLSQGGGQLRALGRQAVAALLNATSSVAYNLTEAQVIQKVNDAIASEDNAEIEAVKDELDELNNMGCPLSNPMDLNADGFVDGTDLLILLGNWGQSGLGDMNEDGVVDGQDLLQLLSTWGWQPAPWTPYPRSSNHLMPALPKDR
jgi:hypothetical protein